MADLEGFEGLSKKLKKLGANVGGKALRSAAFTATLPVVNRAKAAIPVNDRDYLRKTYKGRYVAPGFAKRSIARKTFVSQDKRFVRVIVGVKPEAFYATSFVELGTSTMAAQPWLRPAFEQSQGEIVSRMRSQLKRQIKKAAK